MDAFDERFEQTVAMVRSLLAQLGFRDQYTASHSAGVANYVRQIAAQLRLSDDEIETAAFAAALHDIGKIGVPDHILLKPGKLSADEFVWIQKYPEWGWMTLHQVAPFEQAATLILHVYERMDGSGYPNGLRAKEIPLGSRIIAVADSYDALTTDRPYRAALSGPAALTELIRCAGTQFDLDVVNAFRLALEQQFGENEPS